MNKSIIELNIPEENKILLSKIERRISFLSDKTHDFFEKSISISSKKITEAYSVNEDLISILTKKDSIIDEMTTRSYSIRESHQTNFTKEIQLDISQEIDNISIIKNTLVTKDNLVNSDDKMYVLNKIEKYNSNKNRRRKREMQESIENLESRIENDNIIDIEPIKEDQLLIKSYINENKINGKAYLFFMPIILFLATIIMAGAVIWINI